MSEQPKRVLSAIGRHVAYRETHREEINAKARAYRARFREEINARARASGPRTRPMTRKRPDAGAIQRARFPEKVHARNLLGAAVRRGVVIPQPCYCGLKGQAHHPDYSKSLEVIWLCRTHHSEAHKEQVA